MFILNEYAYVKTLSRNYLLGLHESAHDRGVFSGILQSLTQDLSIETIFDERHA